MTVRLLEKDILVKANGLPVRTVVAEGKITANELIKALDGDGLMPEGMQVDHVSHMFAVEVPDGRLKIKYWEPASQHTPGAQMITIGVIRKVIDSATQSFTTRSDRDIATGSW